MMAPQKPGMTPHDRKVTRVLCWNAALRLVEFNYRELSEAAYLTHHQVAHFVQGWLKTGEVVRLPVSSTEPLRFQVQNIDMVRPKPGLHESAAANMWTAMRGLRSFSPRDIAVHATSDLTSVSREQAQAYCQMLVRAGYLRVVEKAIPPHRDAVYRLVRNTGPFAPVERRIRAVYDENLQKIAHIAGYAA